MYAAHASAAIIAVDTEFTARIADAAVDDSFAAEHTESQSERSSGIADATESWADPEGLNTMPEPQTLKCARGRDAATHTQGL
jgi:hypothetical protein